MMRTMLAAAACKAARMFLRLTGHGGTTLPGRAALFFDPEILSHASEGVRCILVTGTNGKTTTSHMLERALQDRGENVLSNRSGANLLYGISAEFAASTDFFGRPRNQLAVIECDEGTLKHVSPFLKPEVILVTNVFRDQLDRYGEVMNVLEQLREGIRRSPDSILCLNADCSLTASLGRDVPNPVRYYGLDTPGISQDEPQISDARYCILCGSRYEYTYHTYSHLGGFVCPTCGYTRPQPQTAVVSVAKMDATGTDASLELRGGADAARWDIHIGLPTIYNVYNAAAAVCAFTAAGFPPGRIMRSLAGTGGRFGRMEAFELDGVPVKILLVKNPVGSNLALDYIIKQDEAYEAVLCLNDEAADGYDISWIWDVDYEKLAGNENRRGLLVSGTRAEDLQLRLKYAGIPEEEITLVHGWKELVHRMGQSRFPVVVLPNYTAMLALREELAARTGKKSFWEE